MWFLYTVPWEHTVLIDVNFDKKKAKKIFFLTILTAFVPATFLTFAWYLGFFKQVIIQKVQSPYILGIVLSHQGNYQKVGKKIIEVQRYLATKKIECKPIAIYYDDEAKVIKKNLKSSGGCILQRPLKNLPKKYEIIQFKRRRALLGRVSSHPGIAKIKLFAAMKKYVSNNNFSFTFPVITLFDNDDCLLYVFIN